MTLTRNIDSMAIRVVWDFAAAFRFYLMCSSTCHSICCCTLSMVMWETASLSYRWDCSSWLDCSRCKRSNLSAQCSYRCLDKKKIIFNYYIIYQEMRRKKMDKKPLKKGTHFQTLTGGNFENWAMVSSMKNTGMPTRNIMTTKAIKKAPTYIITFKLTNKKFPLRISEIITSAILKCEIGKTPNAGLKF